MNVRKLYILLVIPFLLGACEELLDPVNDNHSNIDQLYQNADMAYGLLINGYSKLPTNSLSLTDVATDDAVTNDKLSSYLRMATGQWSALYNPVSQWNRCNSAILYLNEFLEGFADSVAWKWSDEELNSMYVRRFKGEAYALRGLFEYYLLVSIGGKGDDGNLLGIPIYNKFLKVDDNFNIPRATFSESINQIYSDFDKALEYLTMDDFVDITTSDELPIGLEGADITNFNTVFGLQANQLISGRIIKALKARVALFAASPAFSMDDNSLWEKAANEAGEILSDIGGISGLDPDGHKFYDQTRVEAINLASNQDQQEIIWRQAMETNNVRETDNFPPSLYGDGNINPTQNLVDAFPMVNGYPIGNALSQYDPFNPYVNRDPRLALYIAYNGNTISGTVIKTGAGGGVNAKDSIETSTRTGYYLKKLLREDVSLNPVSTTTKKHYDVHMRYTELFLIYAEAANEAWGPDGTGVFGFSARDVIKAIRKRAGINQPDEYLTSISSKDVMRELIHNERRIELCFEGYRFWDLRRWKVDLTETAKGVNISNSNYNVVNVEIRAYNNDYMHYGPLPQQEVIKYDALIQNKGW